MADDNKIKEKKRSIKKEIRAILIGWFKPQDGYLVANEDNILQKGLFGFNNGANSAKFFGISEYKKQYNMNRKSENWNESIVEKFYKMGIPVYLFNGQKVGAVFIRRFFVNPIVLTIEKDDENLLVSAYMARSIFARIGLARIIKKFVKKLPNEFKETEVTVIQGQTCIEETNESKENKNENNNEEGK